MRETLNRRVWMTGAVVAALVFGVLAGALASQDIGGTATAKDDVQGPIPDVVVAAVSTTTTTAAAPVATTTTVTEPDVAFVGFQMAYNDGYDWGYQLGLIKGDIPDIVTEMFNSSDPEDFGYATGYMDGWQVAAALDLPVYGTPETSAAPTSTTTSTTPAPAPSAAPPSVQSTPAVPDRGYEQGKLDGEAAGKSDGRNTSWNANFYVLGQGPEYTRGFYEAYEWWFDWATPTERRQVVFPDTPSGEVNTIDREP